MCFLYRQSISIVYESKFKYIYRYFIKIDRCFCGILLSLPLRKCGLKYSLNLVRKMMTKSLPLRKCGLKLTDEQRKVLEECHFPCGSVDWNVPCKYYYSLIFCHFPCGSVDWNFYKCVAAFSGKLVTSLAEVWIEIFPYNYGQSLRFRHFPCGSVDWNYISTEMLYYTQSSLPLRKCGLKWSGSAGYPPRDPSLPLRKCGLKFPSSVP